MHSIRRINNTSFELTDELRRVMCLARHITRLNTILLYFHQLARTQYNLIEVRAN